MRRLCELQTLQLTGLGDGLLRWHRVTVCVRVCRADGSRPSLYRHQATERDVPDPNVMAENKPIPPFFSDHLRKSVSKLHFTFGSSQARASTATPVRLPRGGGEEDFGYRQAPPLKQGKEAPASPATVTGTCLAKCGGGGGRGQFLVTGPIRYFRACSILRLTHGGPYITWQPSRSRRRAQPEAHSPPSFGKEGSLCS